MRHLIILISGLLFGIGLALSGMTNPARVIGFLDFFGEWKADLAFVMGGALLVFGLGLLILRKTGAKICSTELPDTSSDPISLKMVTGSALFGIGWGLSGFCPGPALANLAALRTEALVFVPLMLLGMFVAQRLFGLDR